ncbi:uncharacterized protein [Dermacentor albipictus]|uniref:uncharacterized protein isoform X2 n=1 Tax=Dermacentor albipictus TaxID=60249 RepID=UPI0038FCC2C2
MCAHPSRAPRMTASPAIKAMSACDQQPDSVVDVSDFFGNEFAVESVFDYLGIEELFACAEVNRLWQLVALALLRKKLISISFCCSPESEQPSPQPLLDRHHACAEILRPKLARYRNIARLAGMRPSLVFLSYHADLNEDGRGLDCVRELLPPDSVIVRFQLEFIRPANGSDDSTHEGIFGEFLFHAEPAVRPAPTDDDLQLDSSVPGQALGRRSEGEPPAVPVAAAAAPAGGSLPALPAVQPRPRVPSTVRGRGAVFHNVLPGGLLYQGLHVTEGSLEEDVANSYFPEEATGRIIQEENASRSTLHTTPLWVH